MFPALLAAGFDGRIIGLPCSLLLHLVSYLDVVDHRPIDWRRAAMSLSRPDVEICAAEARLIETGYLIRDEQEMYRLSWSVPEAIRAEYRRITESRVASIPAARVSLEVSAETERRRLARVATTELRAQRIAAGETTCRACGRAPKALRNLHLHHVIPIEYGGGTVDANCVMLCLTCHGEAHVFDAAGDDGSWMGPCMIEDLIARLVELVA